MTEEAAIQRYEEAKVAGLSDYEAREDGWPTIGGKMPPTKPARDPREEEIASLLVAIEINYNREGTGYGSRFEGERLEVVQARAVIRRVLEMNQ